MKKALMLTGALVVMLFLAESVQALDPVAPRAFRKFGMLYVKSPNPSDTITYTSKKTGKTESMKSGEIKVIPVGKYDIDVKMQNYDYRQNVLVTPTERTDVEVPGYGNIKINSPFPKTTVEIYQRNPRKMIAKIKAGQVKTLPRGYYNLKIKVKGYTLSKEDIYVVTNTTREVDILPSDLPSS